MKSSTYWYWDKQLQKYVELSWWEVWRGYVLMMLIVCAGGILTPVMAAVVLALTLSVEWYWLFTAGGLTVTIVSAYVVSERHNIRFDKRYS